MLGMETTLTFEKGREEVFENKVSRPKQKPNNPIVENSVLQQVIKNNPKTGSEDSDVRSRAMELRKNKISRSRLTAFRWSVFAFFKLN